MVTNRMKLWNKYHREKFGESWITDSELSFTEKVLYTCLDIYEKREGKSVAPKKYMEKLFSIADSLSEEVEKAGGTEDAAKESIKQFIAHENIPFQRDTYNLIDILNTIDDEENRSANCLGKTTLFACLSEMIDHNLFSKLRKVSIPSHTFIRIKDADGDRDIETTAPYNRMERESERDGVEQEIKFILPAILYKFYREVLDEKILDKILEKYPTFDSALAEKALKSFERNNIFEAEKYIDRALEIFPNMPIYLRIKGDIEYKKGNKRKAREYYEKAMSSKYANEKIKTVCLENIAKIDMELYLESMCKGQYTQYNERCKCDYDQLIFGKDLKSWLP